MGRDSRAAAVFVERKGGMCLYQLPELCTVCAMHGFVIVFDSDAPFRGNPKPGPPGQDSSLLARLGELLHADTCVPEIFMAHFGETIYIRNSQTGAGAGSITD